MRKSPVLFAVSLLSFFSAIFFPVAQSAAAIDVVAAKTIAQEAYLFGYPLLVMETSKWVMTTAETSSGNTEKAGVNQFDHAKTFPDPDFTDVVSPNADTLYSQAWLDLSASPVVLTVPEISPDRYYVMQCLDGWTNVFTSVGTRETGNGSGVYLLTGPGWTGTVPANMVQLKSPTNLVWILGRTETRGPADYPAVHKIQEAYDLRMLDRNAVVPPPPPGTDTKTAPSLQMDALDDPGVFYSRLCRLMSDNPPAAADKPLIDRMALIGMIPGASYDLDALSDDMREAVNAGFAAGRAKLADELLKPQGTRRGAWSVMPDNIGRFGTDYLFRAVIARIALGANLPEEAIYPAARTDVSGEALDGASKYEIRFEKGQLPPVRAFWSITMYNDMQFFVDNPIDRYAIGDRDTLIEGADGSVTLYVQHESPGEALESNWLPAPEGGFNMIMRLYLPDRTILDGTWPMPALTKTKAAPVSGSGSSGCNSAFPGLISLGIAGCIAYLRCR